MRDAANVMEEEDSFEKLSEDEMAQPLISDGEFALDVVEKVFLRTVLHDDEPEVLFATYIVSLEEVASFSTTC